MTLCVPQDSFSLSFVCSSHLIAHQSSTGGIEQQKKEEEDDDEEEKKRKERLMLPGFSLNIVILFRKTSSD